MKSQSIFSGLALGLALCGTASATQLPSFMMTYEGPVAGPTIEVFMVGNPDQYSIMLPGEANRNTQIFSTTRNWVVHQSGITTLDNSPIPDGITSPRALPVGAELGWIEYSVGTYGGPRKLFDGIVQERVARVPDAGATLPMLAFSFALVVMMPRVRDQWRQTLRWGLRGISASGVK